jgi:hypothetical protein
MITVVFIPCSIAADRRQYNIIVNYILINVIKTVLKRWEYIYKLGGEEVVG